MKEKRSEKERKGERKDDVEYNLENRGGAEKIVINFVKNSAYDDIVGKSLKEISQKIGLSEVETIYKLIIENENIINGIFYAISEDGIEKLLQEDFITIGSDGMINIENMNASHPRTFGTFPKIYAKYVREKQIITLENAVHKMTLLPAKIMNLQNHGEIKIGNVGNITIFNRELIKDNSTFENAFNYPSGIEYVIVNGEVILEKEKLTQVFKGEIIKA